MGDRLSDGKLIVKVTEFYESFTGIGGSNLGSTCSITNGSEKRLAFDNVEMEFQTHLFGDDSGKFYTDSHPVTVFNDDGYDIYFGTFNEEPEAEGSCIAILEPKQNVVLECVSNTPVMEREYRVIYRFRLEEEVAHGPFTVDVSATSKGNKMKFK